MLKKLTFLAAAGAVGVFSAGSVFANATALEPGFWEVVTRPDFPGVPMLLAPKLDKMCLSKADITRGDIKLRSMPACKVISGAWQKNTLNLQLECDPTPPGAILMGALHAAGKSFTGEIDLISDPTKEGAESGRFKYHHQGKWISTTCPAPFIVTPDGPQYQ
jgi:hypothetical protein